jgi:hypothetical protein
MAAKPTKHQLTKPTAPTPTTVFGARIADASKAVGISPAGIYRLLAQGKIRAKKNGRTTIVIMDTVYSHIESLPDAEFSWPTESLEP